MIVCCFVVYSPLCKIRANRCESAGTMLIFYFPAPLLERAKRIKASGSIWNAVCGLWNCRGLYNKRLSFFGAIDGAETGFVEVVFHHVLGTGFAVNYEDFANLCGVLMREVILDEFGVVAMA